MSITIANLNKADVLAALYNAAKPQGMGFLHYDPTPMTSDEAALLLKETTRFEYLKGRVMKIDLAGDVVDATWYDCDNGAGSAQHAIDALTTTLDINSASIQASHKANTKNAAKEARAQFGNKARPVEQLDDGTVVLHIGLSDVADMLEPAIDNALKTIETKETQ